MPKSDAFPLRDQTLAMLGASSLNAGAFLEGIPQTGELANVSGDISIWDFVPIAATARAFVRAGQACLGWKR